MTRYLNEYTEGYRLFGEDWKPISDACAALVQYRKWIQIDTRRLTLLTLKLSKLLPGMEKEDYKSIFLDLSKRLAELSLEERELDTFITKSFDELQHKSTKADGIPGTQSYQRRSRHKG